MIILPVKRFKLFYIFAEFQDFVTDVDKRDIEMDFVAQEMKQIGAYVARQLSLKGATFRIQKVTLSPELKKIYDDSVELWVKTRQLFTEATEIVNAHSSKSQSKWSQYWLCHQNFFQQLSVAAKVAEAVKVATDAINSGKCVVIGLDSTSEARVVEAVGNENKLSGFISTAKEILKSFVEKHFPPERSRIESNKRFSLPNQPPDDAEWDGKGWDTYRIQIVY